MSVRRANCCARPGASGTERHCCNAGADHCSSDRANESPPATGARLRRRRRQRPGRPIPGCQPSHRRYGILSRQHPLRCFCPRHLWHCFGACCDATPACCCAATGLLQCHFRSEIRGRALRRFFRPVRQYPLVVLDLTSSASFSRKTRFSSNRLIARRICRRSAFRGASDGGPS
jgi:hypothetical protein